MILALLIWGALAITSNLHAQATLSWQDNSDNEDGFYIERSENGGAFRRIATLPANATSYSDPDTGTGIVYRYRVQAYNSFGVSGYTNISIFELLPLISYDDWIAQFLTNQAQQAVSTPPLALASTFEATTQILAEIDSAPNQTLGDARIPNLLCYVHGINPFDPDFDLLAKPKLMMLNGRETRTIERAVFKYSTGIETTLQASSDLVHWTDLPLNATVIGDTAMHRWEAIEIPSSDQNRFYRLKVSLATKQNF